MNKRPYEEGLQLRSLPGSVTRHASNDIPMGPEMRVCGPQSDLTGRMEWNCQVVDCQKQLVFRPQMPLLWSMA